MSNPDNRSLSLTRIFDAPRELVWQAWTDPAHVGNWWGPNGFSTTTREISVENGGFWRFIMHGPDGTDYKNLIQFTEVVKPERLAYTHRGEDENDDVHFHALILFEEHEGKTRLSMQMVFKSAEELRDLIDKHGIKTGAHQHLGRLADYLQTMV